MKLDRRNFLAIPVASFALPALHALAPESFTPLAVADPVPAHPVDFKQNLPAAGTFPARWICGSESAMDNTDPPTQVHWHNPHTAVLRQNKCYSYEARS